jgi:hypothetical protein
LKRAFGDDSLSPRDAAKKVKVSYATAGRYHALWDEEIRKGREKRLIPQIEEALEEFR